MLSIPPCLTWCLSIFTKLNNNNFRSFNLNKLANLFRKILSHISEANLVIRIALDFWPCCNLHWNPLPVNFGNDELAGIFLGASIKSNSSLASTIYAFTPRLAFFLALGSIFTIDRYTNTNLQRAIKHILKSFLQD